MTRRLLIVRHCDTFDPGEPPRRIGRRTDPPLVATGHAQAEALRAHFAELSFDRILAGPLRRTVETARIIAGREPEIAEWLAEIDHGPDENQPEAAVVARLGAAALAAWDRDAAPPDGWIVDREQRLAAWRAVLAGTGTTLLVTSNGAARYALLAIGEPPARLRTGAYGEIAVAGSPRLVRWDVRP